MEPVATNIILIMVQALPANLLFVTSYSTSLQFAVQSAMVSERHQCIKDFLVRSVLYLFKQIRGCNHSSREHFAIIVWWRRHSAFQVSMLKSPPITVLV